MAKLDPHIVAHLEWIGFVRPTGLVVSAPALVRAQAILNRRDAEGQRLLTQCVKERDVGEEAEKEPYLPDFRAFAGTVLGWRFSPKAYAGTEQNPIPPELEVQLPDSQTILRPAYAVRELDAVRGRTTPSSTNAGNVGSADDCPGWQLLVRELPTGADFDQVKRGAGGIDASAHGYLERLLRGTGVPAGLLFNGTAVRLVSAPRGENSGWVDFRVADMLQTAGRPISTALRLLLSERRLLSLPRSQRLTALLEDSRKFQNEVSERLAEQVLHSLYELLRGFQAAHDASRGELLRNWLETQPDEIYRALLTVVLRLVFLLYAEERDMLPHENETFLRHYSLSGLFDRLREDAALYPDTMDQRFGAWAQLLTLFRMIHDGAKSGDLRLPARPGVLFDPERYDFLDGKISQSSNSPPPPNSQFSIPLVPDGTIYRVLEKLLVLNGERISYRALDVEHVGAVYETMMGFRLETASGRSVAIKAAKKHGAPATVNLEELLGEPGSRRAKWLRDRTDRKLTDKVGKAIREVTSLEALHAALDSVVDKNSTPDLVAPGAMVLQPSEERRRSGSHYTPRELTEPIVRRALEPVLDRLRVANGANPRPEQILDLKVCDPAAGSGAFLVEACRQLGDALVEAWHVHGHAPDLAGADEIVFARRLVARRCLYGVDRNPVAVDLTKLSLWLVTLSRDQPLTFVDHAIRHGDSLVGLSMRQIEGFHWKGDAPEFQEGLEVMHVRELMKRFFDFREGIRKGEESGSNEDPHTQWKKAQPVLDPVRFLGDLVLIAFFEGKQPKEREGKRLDFSEAVVNREAEIYKNRARQLRRDEPPLAPFHWEIEFPEVFWRKNAGFDSIVGNPPFAGKNTVAAGNLASYPEWLKITHPESHGNADLVAHFFRRSFNLVRDEGTFGLIATNTIAQGDTRSTGLRWICNHGGRIYYAHRRFKWPGLAAVVVSILNVQKGNPSASSQLDGSGFEKITAFLFHTGGNENPAVLKLNKNKSFVGSYVLGMGLTFDDTDKKGIATSLAEMRRLINKDERNKEVILPYIGGEEVNNEPTHAYHRYVINFRNYPLERLRLNKDWETSDLKQRTKWIQDGVVPQDYPGAVASDWREVLRIVEERVRPERAKLTSNPIGRKRAKYWWQYGSSATSLYAAIDKLDRVIVISCVGQHCSFTFLPTGSVFSHALIVFASESHAAFCALQSRPHEIWARFFGSSLKDDLRYTPSDCFETFPFPRDWETHPSLEAIGKAYYEFRAELMVSNNQGMTKTYNRFHDPNEDDPRFLRLRELHADMDRAVLDAYGWTDISTECEFLLDYEIDEEEWGRKKKPWRYRWPDPVRDEVLGRLLELNAQRAAEERRSGAKAKGGRRPRRPSQRSSDGTPPLFSE